MQRQVDTERFHGHTLSELRTAVLGCRACPLWEKATQAVPGEGPQTAKVLFVGEQPGDQEDKAGHPFVGPAGRLLDMALTEAGISRDEAFVTNAVKHFKWIPHGKKRLHKTPAQREINACFDWLRAEVELLQPRAVVALGATAAKALLGSDFRVSRERGQFVNSTYAPLVMATIHPSAILRMIDAAARDAAFADFVADLKKLRKAL